MALGGPKMCIIFLPLLLSTLCIIIAAAAVVVIVIVAFLTLQRNEEREGAEFSRI